MKKSLVSMAALVLGAAAAPGVAQDSTPATAAPAPTMATAPKLLVELPASIPLLQKISGASPAGRSASTARRKGTGTTTSSASRSVMSASAPVAVSEGESVAPGRKIGLGGAGLVAGTRSPSRAQGGTDAPSAARRCASAVPQAPPPTTPKRVKRDVMPSLPHRAPLRPWDRAASAGARKPKDRR